MSAVLSAARVVRLSGLPRNLQEASRCADTEHRAPGRRFLAMRDETAPPGAGRNHPRSCRATAGSRRRSARAAVAAKTRQVLLKLRAFGFHGFDFPGRDWKSGQADLEFSERAWKSAS